MKNKAKQGILTTIYLYFSVANNILKCSTCSPHQNSWSLWERERASERQQVFEGRYIWERDYMKAYDIWGLDAVTQGVSFSPVFSIRLHKTRCKEYKLSAQRIIV